MEEESKQQFGIVDPDYFNYLNVHGCFKVPLGLHSRVLSCL
jgi:hypothetical protein